MEKTWPKVGQKLIHEFRGKPGAVTAVVVESDRKSNRVRIRVEGVEYDSLSAAATAISGSPQNGWVYWGLKKQQKRRNHRSGSTISPSR